MMLGMGAAREPFKFASGDVEREEDLITEGTEDTEELLTLLDGEVLLTSLS